MSNVEKNTGIDPIKMKPGRARVSVLGSIVTLVVLLIVGVWSFMLGLSGYREERLSADWPTAQGEIVSARMNESIAQDETGNMVYYEPRVEYTYSLDGHDYRSQAIRLLGPVQLNNPSAAQNFMKTYHQGARVDVYHDPENPSRAFLVRKPLSIWNPFLLIGAFIGIIFILFIYNIASLSIAKSIKKNRKNRNARDDIR